jgi:hypothetical protein
MTDRRDDDFRIRPSAPKNRGQGFVSKVLKQAGKASGGKSSVRRPAAARGTGQRPGSRLGRGHTAARFAGAKLTPMSRRVTIKTLLVNQRQASPQSLAKHLRYIERDGVGRDGEPGQAYGPQTDAADLDAFKERCADDRHHFRFILSPEDGAELEDLRTYTRHLMGRMEADLGTGLDWVAVNHWNTDNPHTHIVVRGRDDTGKDLIIAGDYIADGFRHRAAELATEWLGPRTELEIQQTLQREVEQERWTSLDRTLQREAGEDGRVQIERFNEPRLQRQRLLLIGRLQRLQRLGLADEMQPGTWACPCRCGKDPARPGRAWRHHPHHAAGHARRAARAGGVRAGRRWPHHPRPRGREGAGRRAARPGLSGHRRGGRQGPLRRAQRPRRAGELPDRRRGGGEGIGRRARGRQEHRRAGERWPVPHRSSPGHRARSGRARPRSAGSRRGPRPPAGSPAPGRHRGARGRGAMEGAGRPAERAAATTRSAWAAWPWS